MNLRTSFEAVPFTDPTLTRLRDAYLDSLPHAQELSVELLMPASQHWLIGGRLGVCGYFSVYEGQSLVEFFLEPSAAAFADAVMRQVLAHTQVKTARVKSFDALLLSLCADLHQEMRTLGVLAREFVPRPLPVMPELRFGSRVATIEDAARVLSIPQPVFRDAQRLRGVLAAGWLRLYERDGETLGFGILRPVVAGRPDVEVGIALHPAYRMRGYAAFILQDLALSCVAAGQRPVAGCARENIASRQLGERVGFVARHRLFEFTLR